MVEFARAWMATSTAANITAPSHHKSHLAPNTYDLTPPRAKIVHKAAEKKQNRIEQLT